MSYIRFTKLEKIEIEKLAFSLPLNPSISSGARPEVNVFV